MEKTCKEAFDIYCQYEKINLVVRKKVRYVIDVIKEYSRKSQLQFNDLVALSNYMEASLSKENLTDYEQHLLMKAISLLNTASWGGGPPLMHIIINSITNVSNN